MRLIDANRLKSKITDYKKPHEFKEEIDKAPTVDAIPVEWIEKWGRPHTMDYWSDDGYLSEEHDGYYTIDNMLKDWEKENGRSK